MKKTTRTGIIALILAAFTATCVFAMPFRGFEDDNSIRESIQNKDYEAYINALEKNWEEYKSGMTEEKFDEMIEHHNKKIMNGTKIHWTEIKEKHEDIHEALENEDFEAWKEAIQDSPVEERLSEIITEDNFDLFIEMHDAIEEDDFETAESIAEELGIENIPKKKEMSKKRFNKMRNKEDCPAKQKNMID